MGEKTSRRLAAIAAASALMVGTIGITAGSAHAKIGAANEIETESGKTSVTATQGKARGSGLWGHVGDVKVAAPSASKVYPYGIALDPADASLWVTDSAKVIYVYPRSFLGITFTPASQCRAAGGQLVGENSCLLGTSRVLNYPKAKLADWSRGQYKADGEYDYSSVQNTDNEGAGANWAPYSTDRQSTLRDSSQGQISTVRGIAPLADNKAWIVDSEWTVRSDSTNVITGAPGSGLRPVTVANGAIQADSPTIASAPGQSGAQLWPDRFKSGGFSFPVGAAVRKNGNVLVTNQTSQLLKEYRPDGEFVRNIYIGESAAPSYAPTNPRGDVYSVAVDPRDDSVLVGFADPGSGVSTKIERYNVSADCATGAPAVAPANGLTPVICPKTQTIGLGTLPAGNGGDANSGGNTGMTTFAIAVEPRTGDIYLAQRTGPLWVFASDGTPKGRMPGFGYGTARGQLSDARGIAFDKRGLLYVTTVSDANTTDPRNPRVAIFGRTPDPIQNLQAFYTDETKTSAQLWWSPLNVEDKKTEVTLDAQLPVVDYVVEVSEDDGNTWKVHPTSKSISNTEVVTGLDGNKNYLFRVSAWNEAGNGDAATAKPGTIELDKPEATTTQTSEWTLDKKLTNESTVTVSETGATTLSYQVTTTEKPGKRQLTVKGKATVTNANQTELVYTPTVTPTDAVADLTCTATPGGVRELAGGASEEISYECKGDVKDGVKLPANDVIKVGIEPQVRYVAVPWKEASTIAKPGELSKIDAATGTTQADVTALKVEHKKEYQAPEPPKGADATVTDQTQANAANHGAERKWTYQRTGEQKTYTEKYDVTDVVIPAGDCVTVSNDAKLTAGDQTKTASTSIQLCRPAPLEVTKSIVGSLERTYGWEIKKELNNPEVTPDADGKAALNYTITATKNDKTDAHWTISGQVTIKNPNKYKAVDVKITEAPDLGTATCTIDGSATIPAGATKTLDYSCTFASEPKLSGSNVVKVEYRSDRAGANRDLSEAKTAEGKAEIKETDWKVTAVDDTVAITDKQQISGVDQPEQTFNTRKDLAVGESETFTYTSEVVVPSGTCVDVDNTARIVNTKLSVGVTKKLCRVAPLIVVNDPGAGSVENSYEWSIAKTVTPTSATVQSAPATVGADYVVSVTQGKHTQQVTNATGKITVTNPNKFGGDIPITVTSAAGSGISCAIDGGQPTAVGQDATVNITYTCTGAPEATAEIAHNVTVEPKAAADGVKDLQPVSVAANIKYTVTDINKTVTVADSQYAFTPEWKITWSKEGATDVKQYKRDLSVTLQAGECQTLDNVAKINEIDKSATASIKICRENPTPGDPTPSVPAPVPSETVQPTPDKPKQPGKKLPNTGDGAGLSGSAALILGLGAAIVVIRRRKRAE